MLCDFVDESGAAIPSCPRGVLRHVLGALADRGFAARAAFEIEAMLFTDSLESARRRHFADLTPMATNVPVGYLHHNSRQQLAFVDETSGRLEALGIPVEGWHDEAAPGQFEINLDPTDPLTACDAVIRAKQVMREVALEQGHVVTFMAKPSAEYGNGLHVHHSLVARRRAGVLRARRRDEPHDAALDRRADGELRRADVVRVPHDQLVPAHGRLRRGADGRVVGRGQQVGRDPGAVDRSRRRPASSTGSPAATRTRTSCSRACSPPASPGSTAARSSRRRSRSAAGASRRTGSRTCRPRITRAADALEADTGLAAVLGPDFVGFWINTRRWEWLMFHTTGGDPMATAVTPWELDRYFELA